MIRKSCILFVILALGSVLCLTNGFADEWVEFTEVIRVAEEMKSAANGFILEGGFDFPTAEGPEYIQDTPEFQRVPDVIIGTADFEKMRDLPTDSQDYQLGRKVGWITIPQRNNPDRIWICTGFLVGPDLFMTNHHCIEDEVGRLPLEGAKIYMDYYQEPEVDRTRGGVTARVSELLQADALKDYALLRLDAPIGNTYGWLQLDTTTQVDSSQRVKIIQHPRGRSKEIVRRNSQIFDIPAGHPLEGVPSVLAYLADSEGGSSGAPVFLRDGTGVIAIHHSGWRRGGVPHFNAGSLMSHIVPEIQQWLPGSTAPNLAIGVMEFPLRAYFSPGESFTMRVSVRNYGGVASPATTLRFYESLDNSITPSDSEVGIAFVEPLEPFGISEFAEITLTTPVTLGTYYYGACVDAVVGEEITDDNCALNGRLTVSTTPPVYMYWTIAEVGASRIQRADLNGANVEDLVTGLRLPAGIAVDVAAGKMYWTDWSANTIHYADLDGSNVQTLVTGLSSSPWDIALDAAAGKMYWTMSSIGGNDGEILRANLDGSNIQTLVTGLYWPRHITLDGAGGKMYWTIAEFGASAIQRADLNGANVEDLVTTELRLPAGIALDTAGDRMFWTDWGSDTIHRADLDGSNVQTLVTGLSNSPWGIAVDVAASKMYWTMGPLGGDQEDEIHRADLDGSNVQTLVTGLGQVRYIALGIEQASRPITSITFSPSEIADQTFTVGTTVSLNLPSATGGTAPYTYTLTPDPPEGLAFDFSAENGYLHGTPTAPMAVTTYTYTATDANGASAALTFTIEVIEADIPAEPLDVNGDGQITVIDLAIVALFYGTQVPVGVSLPADVNADGVVDLSDLTAVANGIDAAGGGGNGLSFDDVAAALEAAAEQVADLEVVAEAPMGFGTRQDILSGGIAYRNVAAALADAKHFVGTGDVQLGNGTETVLKGILALLAEMGAVPETTALLPNYPNPFNPETWIPYHLATDAAVKLTIYDMNGRVVRVLDFGHQHAGIYQSRGRAAYWDGRNQTGESVASGLYFYTLTAGDFNATRKLLIAK